MLQLARNTVQEPSDEPRLAARMKMLQPGMSALAQHHMHARGTKTERILVGIAKYKAMTLLMRDTPGQL